MWGWGVLFWQNWRILSELLICIRANVCQRGYIMFFSTLIDVVLFLPPEGSLPFKLGKMCHGRIAALDCQMQVITVQIMYVVAI